MERDDIEKAAKHYQEKDHDIWTGKGMATELQKAFITGAEWRINSVWHDAANGKAENKPALIEYTHRDGSCGHLVVPNPQEVKEAIDRWAYIEDLIPNKED